MRRFLEEGDKVKINIRFRGREMSHQELVDRWQRVLKWILVMMPLLNPVPA